MVLDLPTLCSGGGGGGGGGVNDTTYKYLITSFIHIS